MDLYQKISILGPSARYDTCGPRDFANTTNIPGVYHAKVGGNHICRLFKVLQSNVCKNNCKYCAFRHDRPCLRVTASPDEMAQAFVSAHSRHLVDGLFLSSGIVNNPQTTMTRMLDTTHILRHKFNYKGYIHLKIMPDTPVNCIQESMKLANRISLNIESPTESDLTDLSPDKNLKTGFFNTMFKIKKEIWKLKQIGKNPPSITTQFVVGATEEKDRDIIRATHLLYKQFNLKRVFYSAFRPVKNTPLQDKAPASLARQHRLYQADFLMRFYRFLPTDLPLDQNGFLSENTDPKTLWAEKHPEFFPININKATYWNLLKIPGLGPVSAKKIIQKRKFGKINSLSIFQNQHFQINKMKKYLII